MTDPMTNPVPALDDLRAALVLQREADAMIAEALDTKRSAIERAEALVRRAEQTAARAEEDATAVAAERIAAAHAQAEQLLAEAEEEARRITIDAKDEVDALRHDAAELRLSAQETIDEAERELERVRESEERREQQLRALRTETIRLIEGLEHVTTMLDEMLDEMLDTGEPAPSVVVQWPHTPPAADLAASMTDGGEALRPSKHRRADAGPRRGLLRKARP
jgi:hypothetical protein